MQKGGKKGRKGGKKKEANTIENQWRGRGEKVRGNAKVGARIPRGHGFGGQGGSQSDGNSSQEKGRNTALGHRLGNLGT